MSKSVSRNYIYNLSYQILTLLTPLVTTPYLSRVLGADGIGVYSFSSSIVAYFILLASMGQADYAQREIAYHQDKPFLQSRTFYEVIQMRVLLVACSLLAYYIVISQWDVNHTIYWLQALNIIAVALDISWFFQGLEEFGKIVFRNLIVRILNIALIFLLIHTADDLNRYILLMGAMNLLSAALMWGYLPKYLVSVPRVEIHPTRNFLITLQLFLPQVAIQIYTVLDKTMIGLLTGSPYENGNYEQAEKLVKMSLTVVTSLGTVMLPRIAFAYAHGQKDEIYRYIMRSYRFVWLIGLPMMFGLIGIIDSFVPWFFGPGFDKVTTLVKIFTGLLLAIGINNVTGVQYLIPVGRQNTFTLTVIIGAVVNFVLNLLLIPHLLSLGAAIASVVAETVIALVQFAFVRELFTLSNVLRLASKYLIASTIMLLGMQSIDHFLQLSPTPITTLLLTITGTVIYGSFLYLCQDTFFRELSAKLFRKVRVKLCR